MELLAPAGSEDAMIAAVQNGADAIYIGGSKFSARRSAKNFSEEEIKKVLEYCHIRGVKVHVAANILIKDKECGEFTDYIGTLNELGIDALIIQDIGMAHKIHKFFPDLPLHASTQMTAASIDAVRFLERCGFSRVVLSRELSEKEIKDICAAAKAEIEVFVHGALCMCYSGQCLMSSIIGGRSGNRGMCAQPCRLPYELSDGKKVFNKGYLLSPKDMALSDELKKLGKAGVCSLKIEGRLKRPEYVAAVTNVYSRLLKKHSEPTDKDWEILTDAFNRSGFTKGYFVNKTGLDMMSIKNPGNAAENKIRLLPSERKIPVDIYASFKIGEKAMAIFTDSDFNSVTVVSETVTEKANNKPLSKERAAQQLAKLGGSAFRADSVQTDIDDEAVIPISEINNMRRNAVSLLEKERCKNKKYRDLRCTECIQIAEKRLPEIIYSAKVRNISQAKACIRFGVKRLYAPEDTAKLINENDVEVITVLPPVWRNKDIKDYYIRDGVLCSNIGEIECFKNFPCFGNSRLNVFNSESVSFYSNLKSICVSSELNLNEICRLKAYVPLEVIVYGRIALMVMENCPSGMNGTCGKKVYLKDRKHEEFPLACAPGCYSELLNSKPVYMADKAEDLKRLPVDIYRFEFTDESLTECEKVLSEYINGSERKNNFTRGHYYRGVE